MIRMFSGGMIAAAFCLLMAGCGAADPESGEAPTGEEQSALLPACFSPTLTETCQKISTANITRECCTCSLNGVTDGWMIPLASFPNHYQCKPR
jgi:hypothetical protein